MDTGTGQIRRVILLVIDGLGVGEMPDAAQVRPRDRGADTLGHVVKAAGSLSLPQSLAAIAATIAELIRVGPTEIGRSFLQVLEPA